MGESMIMKDLIISDSNGERSLGSSDGSAKKDETFTLEIVIGRGATSVVFKLNDDKVVKLYNAECSINSLKYEYDKMIRAYKNHVPVPKIYEMVEYKGQAGYVMEYISGDTFKNVLEKDVVSVTSGEISIELFSERFSNYIKLVARCLYDVHRIETDEMETMDDRLKWQVQNTEFLSNEEKDKVISLIDSLPKGKSVCHGDPNPNNLMVNEDGFKLIDWVNAGVGNPLYDIAEYVLLSKPSENEIQDGTSQELMALYNKFKDAIVPMFLEEYEKLSGMDVSDYEMWQIPLLVAKLNSNRSMDEKKAILTDIRNRLKYLEC